MKLKVVTVEIDGWHALIFYFGLIVGTFIGVLYSMLLMT